MSRNRRRTSATLFPYTTLFRSRHEVRGGVHPHPEAARGEPGGRESAGRALAVGARDVDGGEMPLGMAQHVEEPRGRPEAPLDAAPLSFKEKAAGVVEGDRKSVVQGKRV